MQKINSLKSEVQFFIGEEVFLRDNSKKVTIVSIQNKTNTLKICN